MKTSMLAAMILAAAPAMAMADTLADQLRLDTELANTSDKALAQAAAQAIGLRELYQALCAAQAALARSQAAAPDRKAA